jgi:nitrogen regulatory protein P-II 1
MTAVTTTYSLVVAIVTLGSGSEVVRIAEELGAGGGTIVFGRGTSVRSGRSILGVPVEPGREVIHVVVPREVAPKLLRSVTVACRLEEPGTGLAFSLPLDEVCGLESEMELPREER